MRKSLHGEVLDLAMNWPQGRRKVLIELKGGFSGVPEWVQATLRRVGLLKKEPEPSYPNLARLVAEALAPYSQQVEEGFIIAQSFHQPYLHELRHLLPSLPVMYLSLSSATGMLEKENLQHVGLGFAGVAVRHSSLTASALQRLHVAQGQVFVWTVDAVDDIEAAVAIGVDGIITNYPDRAVAILAGSLPPRKRSLAAAVYSTRPQVSPQLQRLHACMAQDGACAAAGDNRQSQTGKPSVAVRWRRELKVFGGNRF